MRRCLAAVTVAVLVGWLNVLAVWAAGEPATQTATFTVTIVRIDAAARHVVVKDRDGKLWDFTVDPKYGIDLRKFKAGDVVTATVLTTAPSDNPQLKARMSKQQLIRLQ